MAALTNLREIEVQVGDVDWTAIGAGATKPCGALPRNTVLKSLNLSFDPSLALLPMDERRHWSPKLATSC